MQPWPVTSPGNAEWEIYKRKKARKMIRTCKVELKRETLGNCHILCRNSAELAFANTLLDTVLELYDDDRWESLELDDYLPVVLNTRNHTWNFAKDNKEAVCTVGDFIVDGEMPINYFNLPLEIREIARKNAAEIDEYCNYEEACCGDFIFDRNGNVMREFPFMFGCIDFIVDGEEHNGSLL